MSYNIQTGITTYKDVPTDAAATAAKDAAGSTVPSTATSFAPTPSTATTPAPTPAAKATPAPAQQPLFSMDQYNAFPSSGWAQGHNLVPVEFMVANGIPLPPQVYDGLLNWINGNSGVGGLPPGASDADVWNKFVAAVEDRESGGGHGFLGTGISTGIDGLDNALGYAQGAMFAGNVGGAALTGGDLGNAALSDALALGGASVAPAVSSAVGGGMLGAAAGGGAAGLVGSLGHGDVDPLQSAATGALTAGAIRGGGELYADLTAPTSLPVPPTATSLANLNVDPYATSYDAYDPLKRGMLPGGGPSFFDPMLTAGADPVTAFDVPVGTGDLDYLRGTGIETGFGRSTGSSLMPGAFDLPGAPRVNYLTGAGVDTGLGPSTGYSTIPGAYTLEGWSPEQLFGTKGMLPPSKAGDLQPTQPTGDELREQRVDQAARTFEKAAKIGSALAKLYEGQGTPQGAPSRTRTNADGSQSQLSDADYSRELTDYAQFDPQALHLQNAPVLDSASLAQMGLTPGTPEYMAYVMNQMDSVIDQLTDGTNPDSPDLASQLHYKTSAEIDALTRALYIRGQMQLLSGSGSYLDPATGTSEDVIVPQGRLVQPSIAAYQRGVARSAQQLSAMQPEDARHYLGGMISREPDWFGMKAAADARSWLESLADQNMPDDLDTKRRRLGGVASADWHDLLDALTPIQLQQLLAGFGGR